MDSTLIMAARDEEFDLDVTAVERTDQFNTLVAATDDNCGSTCGACTTGVH
jgi:FxLD family lantipeptide